MAFTYKSYCYLKKWDGTDTRWLPYVSNSIEEVQGVNIISDHIGISSSSTHATLGRVLYAGTLSFPLCVEVVDFLKDWFITDRYSTEPFRQIVLGTGLSQYRYTRMYPGSWNLSCTAGGNVMASIDVLGCGEEADDGLRKEEAYEAVTEYPRYDGYRIPIPWASVTLEGSGGYTFASENVTAWNFTVTNGYRSLPTGNNQLAVDKFLMGPLEITGSTTLFHATVIGEPGALNSAQVVLSLPQTAVGIELGPATTYLTLPKATPTNYPDSGSSRRELRTRTIDWVGLRTTAQLAVY